MCCRIRTWVGRIIRAIDNFKIIYMRILTAIGIFTLAASLLIQPARAQSNYYFPGKGGFDPAIPTPEQFLGYPIGSHYTRHEQIIAYFNELARVSGKIHVQVIGK